MLRFRPHPRALSPILIAVLLAELALVPQAAAAQATQAPAGRGVGGRQATPGSQTIVVDDQDAQRTRDQLNEILQRYPPDLGRVLKLAPSLLANQQYLEPYPGLASFLTQHPEVRQNPGYFFARVPGPDSYTPPNRQERILGLWEDILGGLLALIIGGAILSTLIWLIRMLIDYRRWNRLSRVQAEAHTKLLDRFTANDELLAYVKSPAGMRFLESAPIALEPGARRIGAPFNRILWSVQAGLVLFAGGLGLRYVSARPTIDQDVTQPLFAMGVLAVALGLGFVLSAVVSYVLSQRLGLFQPPPAGPLADRPENTSG